MCRSWRAILCAFLWMAMAGAAAAQNLRMGTRYHLIDKEVESVTTRFESVEVTTSRLADGRIETRFRTADGQAIGRPLISQPEQVRLVAQEANAAGVRNVIEVDLQPLDAVNADRYLAWKAGRLGARRLFADMPKELIGTEGPAEMGDAARDVRSVTTRTRALEAFSRHGNGAIVEGREQPSFTSVLRIGNEILAVLAWYEEAQTLVYQAHWSPEARYLTAEQFPEKRWPFRPNMAWANLQLISYAKSEESRGALVLGEKAPDGRPFRLAVQNSPGCDGLHWLDGTMMRECCDIHDACYAKEDPDCTYTSWWFQGSWSCVQCNIQVILCMGMLQLMCDYWGMCPPFIEYPDSPPGMPWPPNCYIRCCQCPAWCAGCSYF